jgi:tRNA modification GTPase
MYNPHDTICAISTPPGESALAIVRMSGKNAINIIEKLFRGVKLTDRKASIGQIVDSDGDRVDEAVTIWYKGPKSYTGEDLVEVICHGGHVVPEQVFSLMRQCGARMAEKGEFTLRAFLNGRMDLTEAEAVASIISAKTEKSKRLAMNNLEGRLSESLAKISTRLVELITILEAEIDFADEEVAKLSSVEIRGRIEQIKRMLSDVISTYDIGRISEGRAQVAIVGAPNVGKSSLFNAILKTGRAIVTDVPGTTRDYISEYVNIGGFPVILTDTAGIRTPDGEVEEIGIYRSREVIDKSDLCLFILDNTRALNDEDGAIKGLLNDRSSILAVNKIDIAGDVDASICRRFNGRNLLHISAKTGEGIEALVDLIKNKLKIGGPASSDGIILSQRQYDCARAAQISLKRGANLIRMGESEEVYIGEIREALDQIGMITGKITNDDILNRIFSEFCIGK